MQRLILPISIAETLPAISNRALAALLCVFLASCQSPSPTNSAQEVNVSQNSVVTSNDAESINGQEPQNVTESEKIPVSIRTVAGGEEQQAYLVAPLHLPPDDQLEAAINEAGFPCGKAEGIHQLEQTGERMDVYKIDCSTGSYQMTSLNGGIFFKRWTGVMAGQ